MAALLQSTSPAAQLRHTQFVQPSLPRTKCGSRAVEVNWKAASGGKRGAGPSNVGSLGSPGAIAGAISCQSCEHFAFICIHIDGFKSAPRS